MNPDCRDGKHASCSGDGWDNGLDEPAPCPCSCHPPAASDPHPILTRKLAALAASQPIFYNQIAGGTP